MEQSKELKELKNKVQNLVEEKEKCVEELEKLIMQAKNLGKKEKVKERKKRNHRLIVRGAILEDFIEGAEEKSKEEFISILENTFGKNYNEILKEKEERKQRMKIQDKQES